ncbi:hybrid sensor histidine kinase/response regulator [Gimibacter soli]|uniref:histidine kinase n=1 Tax=Gimibacter soli TaxID=3024400 RepID=A0AAE9XUR9_9PROT|nr:hybrid sensor histidine kinase/response regulator [Gimibacter soli]WCL55476.1 response regulator [Gimibacter soli]
MHAEDALQATLEAQVQRENALSALHQLMGYGGFIHNFKNYVLRGEADRAEETRRQINGALTALTALEKSFNQESFGFGKGREVRSTLQAYLANLDVAIEMKEAGAAIADIDRRVRIDDRMAGRGLAEIAETSRQIGLVTLTRAQEDIATWQTSRDFAVAFFCISILVLTFGPALWRRVLNEPRKQLAFTDDLLTSMEHAAGSGYFVRDLATGDLKFSEGLFALLKLDPVDGHPSFERLTARCTPEERHIFEDVFLRDDLDDDILTRELVYRSKADEERILKVRVRQRTKDRKSLVVGLVMDVTEERRDARELLTARQRFELARQSISLGLWDLNVLEETKEWDQGMFDIYGIDPAQFTGRRDATINMIHSEDRASIIEAFKHFLQSDISTLSLRYRVTRGDGREIWINRRAVAKCNDHGEAIRVVGMDIDITREIEVEAELRKALKAVSTANRAKSNFLAMVSHEVRTPLTAMLGMLDLISVETDDPQITEYLAIIRENGEHLTRILNDILDMSKSEAGKLKLTSEPFLPYRVVTQVARLFEAAAAEKGLSLAVQVLGDSGLYLLGDGGRIRQIASNLIGNAVKYTAGGSVTATLAIDPPADPLAPVALRLTIDDTGTPIDPAILDRLFLPFERGTMEADSKIGGTGLGLSISRRIAQMMNGDVTYTAVSRSGNRFTFTALLPKSQEQRDLRDPTPGRQHEHAKSLKILIVEDIAINRRILEKKLAGHWGMQLVMAENGLEAVNLMRSGSFDLVLMDIQMPEMTGTEAVELIRATMPEHAATPIIALTANAFDDQRREYLRLGFNDCLTKPYDWNEMYQLLSAITPIAAAKASTGRRKNLSAPAGE